MCVAGYSGDGRTCTDVNECTTGMSTCSVNATCMNVPGSYTCTCNTGYVGDGRTCTASGPTCTTIEGFEAGAWPVAPWTVQAAGGTASGAAAHDGAFGLVDPGWHYETATTVGLPGDRLIVWARDDAGGAGRIYFGFDATAAGCKSFVFAPNTGDIRFQDNATYGFTELMTTPFTATPARWYKMEITFRAGGIAEGRLYDSDGTTLRATVTQTYAGGIGVNGVALRSFGGFSIDTVQRCR